MKKLIFTIFGVFLFYGLFSQEIPHKISYQGRLLENNELASGTKSILFTIGSWTETHPSVQITNGLYSVTLGEITAIPASIFDNGSSVSMQIKVEGTTLSPQTEILSVPYAYKAEIAIEAEPIGIAGGDFSGTYPNPTVAKIQGKTVSSTSPSSGQILKYNGSQWIPDEDEIGGTSLWTQNDNDLYYNSGNVGIGTSIPMTNLHLLTTINGGGAILETSTENVYLVLNNTGTNGNYWRLASTSGTSTLGGSTGNFAISNNGMEAQFVINNSGNVGINTSNPQELLNVAGGTIEVYPATDGQRGIRLRSADQNKNFILDMKNDGTMQIGANSGTMQLSSTFGVQSRNLSGTWRSMSASSFDVQSSRNLKINIEYIEQSGTEYWLKQILLMKPANYNYNLETESTQPKLGLIAEDLPKELRGQDGESVNLFALTTAGIASIKCLYQMLDKQQNQINRLQVEIELLKKLKEE